MGITVKLNGGVELHVNETDFDALQSAFQTALAEDKPLHIHSPDGRLVVVNPRNILYMEGPEGAMAPPEDQAAAASTAA